MQFNLLHLRKIVPAFLLWSTLGQAQGAEWEQLFNGSSLEGWKLRGGLARYEVQNGTIVGTTVRGGPNTFLCTTRQFGDFILELEFKVQDGMNSGIQIRSESRQDFKRGVVHGYQVEIDTSKRAWSGGIYDESRRGWLNDLKNNPDAQAAFKHEDWNHYRIHCFGDHIRTWINGVPAADLRDTMTLKGFIALQVHSSDSQDPQTIAWKNIRILDLGYHEWEPLFNGENLDGWQARPGGQWSVQDGIITGSSPASEPRHGILLSQENYADFTVRFDFRVNSGDSGFYFRAEPVDSAVSVHGFQIEIDETYETGGLYETGGRAWVVQYPPDKPRNNYKKGQWNSMSLSAHGRNLIVHLNNQLSARLDNDPGRTQGHFGLQLHGGQEMNVNYRGIEILRHVPRLNSL